jgi:hypothetical protein
MFICLKKIDLEAIQLRHKPNLEFEKKNGFSEKTRKKGLGKKKTSLGGHPIAPQLKPGEVHERPLGNNKMT